jgi:RNA polymerase sigma-70 factor (ECF subfamily)
MNAKGSSDDVALLEAAQAGDRKALGAWLQHYEDAIYRFAIRMCGDEENAKEVLQESLLAAAKNVASFRGDAAPTTWLFTIARSFCSKQRRRRKDEPASYVPLDAEELDRRPIVDASRTPDEAAEGRQLDRAIAAAIESLDAAQREVLVLRDVEGLSAAEVAAILGISVEAVKSRLHRARVSVRDRLAPLLGGAPPSPSCPDLVPIFSRHLEGEVDPATCAEMERHLASCPRCKGACDALRRTLARCASGLGDDVPDDVRLEVRAAVQNFLKLRA